MKLFYYVLFAVLISACNSTESNNLPPETPKESPKEILKDSVIQEKKTESTPILKIDSTEKEIEYYVVVADTGLDYYILRNKMFELSEKISAPIDSLDREYNKSKNLIALPIDDMDPIFAGKYFHRRFPSNTLSLEYIISYQDNSRKKNIGLVTGIYHLKSLAVKRLKTINDFYPEAFIIKKKYQTTCNK